MKREYDFTGAEQGKFYTPKENLVAPYYLKPPGKHRMSDTDGTACPICKMNKLQKMYTNVRKALFPQARKSPFQHSR